MVSMISMSTPQFERVDISIDTDPGGEVITVLVVTWYDTHQGPRIGEVTERKFLRMDAARAKANEFHAKFGRLGYRTMVAK